MLLKTRKSDNESDTAEPVDNLCDPFAPTIVSRNSKNIIWVERLFNCWIDANDDFKNNSVLQLQLVLFGEQEEHTELEIEKKLMKTSLKRPDEKVFSGNMHNCKVTININ